MSHVTPPCLDSFCRLDRLGLTVTGQLVEPDHTVLTCVPTTAAVSCAGCDGPGARYDGSSQKGVDEGSESAGVE